MNFVLAGATVVAMALPQYAQFILGGLYIALGIFIEVLEEKP
jgi:cadmium resistance protein CadD (predicted permease)